MRKKPKSNRRKGYAITGKDWLMLKPYTRNTAYDYAYVELANQLHGLLSQHWDQLAVHLPEVSDVVKELSLIFTSYFEDILNELGIWQVFLDRNQERFGFYLPFEVGPDYEAGNLNQEDLHYILWHFANEHKGSFFAPDGSLFKLIAGEVYSFLFDKWDELPLTDFYEDWLSLSDDDDFFEIKERLHWLSLKSYVLGFEFGTALGISITQFIEENEVDSEEDLSKILYAFTEEFLFDRRSTYAALNAPEWLAALCRGPEKVKEAILETQLNLNALMKYKGGDEHYHHCEFPALEREFAIVKESVDIPPIPIDSNLLLHLIPFKGRYWFSGSLMTWPPGPMGDDAPPFIPFYLHDEDTQQMLRETTEAIQHNFSSFFGSLIVPCKSREEVKEKLSNFWTYQHQKHTKKKQRKEDQEALKQLIQMNEQSVPREDDLALVFEAGVGIMFQPLFNETQLLLEKTELTQTEHEKLFFYLIKEMHPNVLKHFWLAFPDRGLSFPDPRSDFDLWPALPFLSCYSNPGEHGPSFPQASFR